MILEKGSIHLQNSAITQYTISCNISLYCDTIYQYTQNVYHCISNTHTHTHIHTYKHTHICYAQVDIMISKHHALHILFHV